MIYRRTRRTVPRAFAASCALRADTVFTGRVTNDNNAPVPGARIILTRPSEPVTEAVSDQAGFFSFP